MEPIDFLIRPISSKDLKFLITAAKEAGTGFTSLPDNKKVLKQHIDISEKSFRQKIPIPKRKYMLVLELNNQCSGIAAIKTKVGNQGPFYNYKVSTIMQTNQQTEKTLTHKLLNLVNDFQEANEVGMLFLSKNCRGKGYGKFLSRARFLLMAQFRSWFSTWTIAEIRGYCDQQGNSPFWNSLGQHFFAMDFKEADYLTFSLGKQFIADLMPTYPIYVDLLSNEAKSVIGQPHPHSKPAKIVLEQENFYFKDYVDIFDAGPLLITQTNNIKTVQNSKLFTVNNFSAKISNPLTSMISNTEADFKITIANYRITDQNTVELEHHVANLLNIKIGDNVRIDLDF